MDDIYMEDSYLGPITDEPYFISRSEMNNRAVFDNLSKEDYKDARNDIYEDWQN